MPEGYRKLKLEGYRKLTPEAYQKQKDDTWSIPMGVYTSPTSNRSSDIGHSMGRLSKEKDDTCRFPWKVLLNFVEIVAAQMGLAGSLVKVEKLDGVPSAAEDENSKLGGRKMIVKEMIQEEDSAIISGAAHQYRRKGILNVECKLRNRTTSPSKKVKMGGFTAFNADYHVPKSHPPKNN
ncbi:hypothetical protein LWI29_021107 [Acer saccharum]|uniref:Uncharacterized protein n=1 Tax=Acer saccharum TaxID=4024 RepID=A0AA39S9V4_ACESA|nr:hypothetical protein LWI29_021107 [Acer saccharum]